MGKARENAQGRCKQGAIAAPPDAREAAMRPAPFARRMAGKSTYEDDKSGERATVAAAALLPQIVATARKIHRTDAEIRTAALLAWTALAGISGWTPAMVSAVEREMRA